VPNKVYTATETSVSFKSGAGAAIVGFSPMALLSGSGCISHPRDFGSSARASLFSWRARSRCGAVPTLRATIDMYLCTSEDAEYFDGNMASGDYAFANTEKRANFTYIDSLSVDTAASGEFFVGGGELRLPARYGRVAWINNSGAQLSAGSGDHEFILYPKPDEIQ
jgi:hypothetical protein